MLSSFLLFFLPGCWESCAWYTWMMSPVSFSQLGIPSIPHSIQSCTFFHRFRLPRILQERLQLPIPLCCGKHNNLEKCKRGEKKKSQFTNKKFCWPLSLQDFNPAVNYQLICFAFSLALCSSWKATSVDFPITKYSLYSHVAAQALEDGISSKGGVWKFHLNLI